MSDEKICVDRKTNTYFKIDTATADRIQRRLNQEFRDLGFISINQVYDILNQDLPEDKQIHPNLHGWVGDTYGYASRVGDDDFEFEFRPIVGRDGTIWLEFECLPKEDSE